MKKFSKFNILFKESESFYIYNSSCNFLAELDEDAYHKLKHEEKKQLADNDWLHYPAELLSANVFLTDEEERDIMYNNRMLCNLERYDNSNLTLVIAPTYHCNFACPYCYEPSRPTVYMSDETADNIVEYVKSKNNVLKSFHVTWFGGEPLLNFRRIKNLTKKFLELGIDYDADIITNGYLLDEEKINQLEDLKINTLQITIDGLEEEHNKRRPHLRGLNTYVKITNNLDVFYSKERKSHINIRVNIDKNNKDDYYELQQYLTNRYPKASVAPSPIFIKDTGCKAYADCLTSAKDKFEFNHDLNEKLGRTMGYYPSFRGKECIARHVYSFIIGADGEMYKCFDQIGHLDKSVGNLNDKRFKPEIFNRYIVGADPFDDPKCKVCKLFPLCSGGCPMIRLENEKAGKELYNPCILMKDMEQKLLILHLDSKKIQNEK